MKKLLLSSALALAFALALGGKPERGDEAPGAATGGRLRPVAAAPVPAGSPRAGSAAGRASAAEAGGAGRDQALPAVAPTRLFPHARVISQVEVAGRRTGEIRLIKTVETREKLIRIEETYADGVVNGANLVRESAMVANQVLTQRPEAMAEESFVRILGENGAAEIRKIGEAFLVTFRAEPENPRALDTYIARLKAALGAAVVEPNYIRHLL